MIPPFNPDGNLPAGIHVANWDEIVQRFGWTLRRQELLRGLLQALKLLQRAGCQRVYLNGSFVTGKDQPGDIDVAWELGNVDVDGLLTMEPVFGEFENDRASQKRKFGCEFFPASFAADGAGNTFLEFFQTDKETGQAKGIIALSLERLDHDQERTTV